MFSTAKDAMTSQAARAYLNNFIKRYGHVEELTIDSRRHRIELVCQLRGEASLIGITIEEYRIEKRGVKKLIQVVATTATRPWLEAVMQDHVAGRSFEVPSWAAAAL